MLYIIFGIAVVLFLCVLYEKTRTHGMSNPNGPPIIPNMDLQYDSQNNKCAPPPCGQSGSIDKRDFGLAMTGCEKTFLPVESVDRKPYEMPGTTYFEDLDTEFMQYSMRNGAQMPFKDVYESYNRLQQLVFSTPKDTLYEKTQNPRRRNYLTTTY